MNKSVVALVKCDSYGEAEVLAAVEKGIDLLGGISKFAKSQERIVLKPNVLFGVHPDKCVSTHPAVMGAAGQLLQRSGVDVYYGDSSDFGRCERNMRRAHLKQTADRLGFTLGDFDEGRPLSNPDGQLVKQFTIANAVLDTDGLISLSKMKTHMFTRFTGAVKNQFGCIPGVLKAEHHARIPDPYDFSAMLVDLNLCIKPRLYIMDGIMAMEGNGPRSGKPRHMGVLLFSTDPVALDSVACKIIDMPVDCVPTFKAGETGGLGTCHYENIEIVGERVETFITKDFDIERTPPVSTTGGFVMRFFKNHIAQHPFIDKNLCSQCGSCIDVCPIDPKGLGWSKAGKSKPPVYDYGRCIRCYCCQELCHEGAISARDTLWGIIFRRMNRLYSIYDFAQDRWKGTGKDA